MQEIQEKQEIQERIMKTEIKSDEK